MEQPSWNEGRLDDLNKRVDDGFKRMDRGFEKVDGEFKAVRGEMKEESTAVRGEMQREFTAVKPGGGRPPWFERRSIGTSGHRRGEIASVAVASA